jgi:hypothetical protein
VVAVFLLSTNFTAGVVQYMLLQEVCAALDPFLDEEPGKKLDARRHPGAPDELGEGAGRRARRCHQEVVDRGRAEDIPSVHQGGTAAVILIRKGNPGEEQAHLLEFSHRRAGDPGHELIVNTPAPPIAHLSFQMASSQKNALEMCWIQITR